MHPRRQEVEVPGKKQMILKFAGGTQGVAQESPEVAVAGPAAPSAIFAGMDVAARTSWDCSPQPMPFGSLADSAYTAKVRECAFCHTLRFLKFCIGDPH
jgi:hypothetical protein